MISARPSPSRSAIAVTPAPNSMLQRVRTGNLTLFQELGKRGSILGVDTFDREAWFRVPDEAVHRLLVRNPARLLALPGG